MIGHPPFISGKLPRFHSESPICSPLCTSHEGGYHFERDGIRSPRVSQQSLVVSDLMPPRGRPCSASMECLEPSTKTIELKDLDNLDYNSRNLGH